MSQLLTLSRAAQLIGVTRGALQEKIRNGELTAHEGMVASEDLQRVFPDLKLEQADAFEHITQIKEWAFIGRTRERRLPAQEVLARRLFTQSEELNTARRHLTRYHDLLLAVRARVDALAKSGSANPLAELAETIDGGLASILGGQDLPDKVAAMSEMLRVMTAQVTVRPSGHEFFVEGSETILEAALHAGLAPSYGCGNGNCGLCKARVVSGETRQIRHTDYPMSAAELAQNYKLLCSHTAVSDLVIEMIEAHSPADIPQQQITAKVKTVSPLDAHTYLMHLTTPRTNRLRFLAGQSVTLGYAGSGLDFRGDYPIASCPCDDRSLMFHISRADAEAGDGFAARLFAGAVHSGDAVDVWGPFGEFVLGQETGRPLAFLCCDTGFAPVRSLVEHALSIEAFPAITIYWAATRKGGHYLANQCRVWADAIDHFGYRALDADEETAAGRMAAAALLADGNAGACDIYVAGKAEFVDAASSALTDAGIPRDRIVVTAP